MSKIQESDLFPYLRDYFLQDPKNEIFTEVAECGGPRPDIVVRNGAVITVVEMKTSLTMKLLEQAFQWRYKANYVYIAVPKTKSGINKFVYEILRDYGIGLLEIKVQDEELIGHYQKMRDESDEDYWKNWNLAHFIYKDVMCPAKFFRIKKIDYMPYFKWKNVLKDMYRYENNCNGGNRGGGYNTPYKSIIDDVKRFIKHKRNNEWTLLKDILDNVDSVLSHYSSPKSSLYSALTTIEFKDIESKIINGKIHFRVKEKENENN